MHRVFRLFLMSGILLAAAASQAQQAGLRVRGDVVAVDGVNLQIKAPTGEIGMIKLLDSLRVSIESRATLADVVPGVYVGTTSAPQPDGSLRAVQIRIFPEAMRGTGEGHRNMDPQGNNTMTNATVADVGSKQSANTMTNATVANMSDARTMTLKYKDGEKLVIIPPDVAVISTEIGTRAALVPGVHVVVTVNKLTDGSVATERVTVGKDGAVPM